MEQRPLRLGDIVDDYCPRERRITNHAIVALVEQNIRQTRCTTCDAEHVYKDARPPRRRKPDEADGSDPSIGQIAPRQSIVADSGAEEPSGAFASRDESPAMTARNGSTPSAADESDDRGEPEDGVQPSGPDEYWPAHRTLIRASLPRVEGEQPPPRPIPEFTMHQRPAGRGQHFRGASWNGGGNGHFRHGRPQGEVNGNTVHGHGSRHGGGHGQPGGGRGHGHGQGSGEGPGGQGPGGGQGQGHPGGGRPGGRHRHRGGRPKTSR